MHFGVHRLAVFAEGIKHTAYDRIQQSLCANVHHDQFLPVGKYLNMVVIVRIFFLHNHFNSGLGIIGTFAQLKTA